MSDDKTNKLKSYEFGTYVVTTFETVLQNYSTGLDAYEVYAVIPASANGGSAPGGDNSNSRGANDN